MKASPWIKGSMLTVAAIEPLTGLGSTSIAIMPGLIARTMGCPEWDNTASS